MSQAWIRLVHVTLVLLNDSEVADSKRPGSGGVVIVLVRELTEHLLLFGGLEFGLSTQQSPFGRLGLDQRHLEILVSQMDFSRTQKSGGRRVGKDWGRLCACRF